jgi:hypothetical protein
MGSTDPSTKEQVVSDRNVVRPVLWCALVISMAANAVTSTSGLPVLVGVSFGLVTLACAVGLVAHHYRNRVR